MVFRHSATVKQFLQAWDAMLAKQLNRVDYIAFNTLLAQRFEPLISSKVNPHAAYSLQDGLQIGVLSPALFCHGHSFFVQKMYKVVSCWSVLLILMFASFCCNYDIQFPLYLGALNISY